MNEQFYTDDTFQYLTGKARDSYDVNYEYYIEYYKKLYDRVDTDNFNFDANYTKDDLYRFLTDDTIPEKQSITDEYKVKLDSSNVKKRLMHEDVKHDIMLNQDINNNINTPEPELASHMINYDKKMKQMLQHPSRQDRYKIQSYKADMPIYEVNPVPTNIDLRQRNQQYRDDLDKKYQPILKEQPTLTNRTLQSFIMKQQINQNMYDYYDPRDETKLSNRIIENPVNTIGNNTTMKVTSNISSNSKTRDLPLNIYDKNINTRTAFASKTITNDSFISHEQGLQPNKIKTPFKNSQSRNISRFEALKNNTFNSNQRSFNVDKFGVPLNANQKIFQFEKFNNQLNRINTKNALQNKMSRFADMDTGLKGFEFIQQVTNYNIPNIKQIQAKSNSLFEVVLDNDKIVQINSQTIYTPDKVKQILETINPNFTQNPEMIKSFVSKLTPQAYNIKKDQYAVNQGYTKADYINTINSNKSKFSTYKDTYKPNISNDSIDHQSQKLIKSSFGVRPGAPSRNVEQNTNLNSNVNELINKR